MDQDVYSSIWLKAAAMIQTIALHEPLENRNAFFAWLAAEVFLNTNGVYLQYEPKEALDLVVETSRKNIGVQEIASRLRGWTTAF